MLTGWRLATERALYGESGFYRPSGTPGRHFRTSAHVSPRFADAVLALAEQVDAALGQPPELHVVDLGAGGGELAAGLAERAPDGLRERLLVTGVDLAPRPDSLPDQVRWANEVPAGITGLVIANEWLDNVAVDVVELTGEGARTLLVDSISGAESAGGQPDPADAEWLARWSPLSETGDRAEIGRPRDEAWAELLRRLVAGVAVAIDYGHLLGTRPPRGTLTGYRDGRTVPPVPDGSCDLTAHLAVDACAAAGELAGARDTMILSQRDALCALGLRGARPPAAMAGAEPLRYLAQLRQAGEEAELIDPGGLGGFHWLVQSIGMALPAEIRAATGARPDPRR